MLENKDALYMALQARDARFDGRFFVGISSTGIYCRPVCKAKHAKRENCTFYETAAEAEQAGYRPCLLCRPELAPGMSVADASASLARRAARLLEESCSGEAGLLALAGRLGCTDRHLRRVFAAEYHVSPVQYVQTCRLLLAKNLLTDTTLPVTEIALAAGFQSVRRFNELFQKQYRLSPTALRKQLPKEGRQSSITLALGYRPPYHWEQMLAFLEKRAISGVELVKGGEYWRTVRISAAGEKPLLGWVQVAHRPGEHVLAVTLSEALLPVLPQVLARIRQQFDLYCDPDVVYQGIASMNALHPGLCVPGTRVPGSFDAFEMAVRAVLGQQVTIKTAGTLLARLVAAYGTPLQTGIPGLTHAFPAPGELLALEGPIENHLGPLGIIATRARTILALAGALEQGEIQLGHCAQPEEELKKLTDIPGIGNWTAQYIAMRAMGWPDAFLETDAGIKKALAPRAAKEILQLAEAWRPWRSYAMLTLWNSMHT